MSLCEIPAPSPEMIELYNTHKATFMRRLINFYNKVHDAAAPVFENAGNSNAGQNAREFAENLQVKPEFQALVKVAR